MTRVLVVGSISAAGLFSAIAAWAQPGRTKAAATNTSAPAGGPLVEGGTGLATAPSTSAPVGSPTTVAPDNRGDVGGDNLAPPDTLPDPGYQYPSPAVVSGAS